MANHKGSEGTVKIGTNVLAEVKSWSLDQTGDTLEDTSMGDSARTFQSSLTSWSGSVDVFWDETDTSGQGALTIGASVAVNLYPEGADSGDTYFSGTCLVTSIGRIGSFDGMVEASFGFQGTAALTEGTV
tara:strand:- start:47 stop:436 length:390 start_codon:yes stop_codon:yes gene_type:complete